MLLTAFKGRDNTDTIKVKKDGAAYDMQAAGFTTAKIYVQGTFVEGTLSTDTLEFTLGTLTIPPGEYRATLVIESTVYPNGLAIAGEGLPEELTIVLNKG